MRRSNNQDSYAISLATDMEEWEQHGHLFIVADGMGAHAAGELASKLAVENVAHIYRKHPSMSPPEGLERSIREANQEIHRRGEANLEFHNMGTTCSALLLLPQGALTGHVGDSRVYRMRGEQLDQLTFDHSLVWEMREAGQLTGASDESNVPKNVITRSLGPQAAVKVDIEGPFPLQAGDTFLICSDGLTGRVEDPEIATILRMLAPEEAATFLTNLANLRGGPDNITVVVVRVTSEDILKSGRLLPLTVGGHQETPTVLNPGWWIGLGVCGLLTLTLFIAKGLPWAIPPGILSVILLAVIMVQAMDLFRPEAIRLGGGHRLGKGPHRQYKSRPLLEFATQMNELFQGARRLAEDKDWNADWTEFDRLSRTIRDQLNAREASSALSTLVPASSLISSAMKVQKDRGIQDWPPRQDS